MLNPALDNMRRDQTLLIAELQAAGAKFKGRACTCPFHEDRHPSAGVYCDDGVWKFKCQAAGCAFAGDVFDVRAKASGRSLETVLHEASQQTTDSPRAQTPPAPRVYVSIGAMRDAVRGCVAVHAYTNPDTRAVDMAVLRVESPDGKRFLQASPAPGGFVMQAPPKPWPIYNRTRARGADAVVMVEGEKCVEALAKVGIVATTTPGGAGKAEHADLSPLAGKTVYLWPDADPPNAPDKPNPGARTGIEHMRDIGARLDKLGARCLWIDCDKLGLPPKGDAFDFLDAMEGSSPEDKRAAVVAVLGDAEPMGASAELREHQRAIAAGEFEVVEWPWPMLTRGTQALMPGSITILAGDPGATKSFLLIQAAAWWHDHGIPIALFEVEKDRKFHLTRAIAQRSGCAMMTNIKWRHENHAQADHILSTHAAWADSFGQCIHDRKGQSIKLPDMAKWVDRMGASGKRVIAIDPISLCSAGKDRFIQDEEFMMAIEESANRHGTSIILVTHPVKAAKGPPTMGNTSGGASYERANDTLLWVTSSEEPTKVTISRGDLSDKSVSNMAFRPEVYCNRTIKLLKTRNGRGNKWNLAYQFSGESLTFEELGGIIKENKSGSYESEVA